MSVRRTLVGVVLIALLFVLVALWWRHGTSVFLSNLGSMICDTASGVAAPHA